MHEWMCLYSGGLLVDWFSEEYGADQLNRRIWPKVAKAYRIEMRSFFLIFWHGKCH